MDHDDALWLAGLLEGEGSFIVYRGRPGVGRPCARVQLHMTDRDVIERAAAVMQATAQIVKRKKAQPHWQATYQAHVAGAAAERVMLAVLPHMGQRRSAKINEILCMDLSHRPKGAQ